MNRVLLVEDHATFREPLAFMFGREPEFEVVAQAGSLAEARGMLGGIDLAVVDMDLPDGDGEVLAVGRRIHQHGVALPDLAGERHVGDGLPHLVVHQALERACRRSFCRSTLKPHDTSLFARSHSRRCSWISKTCA